MKRKNVMFSKIFGHFRSYFLNGYRKLCETFTKHCSMFLQMDLDYLEHYLAHPFFWERYQKDDDFKMGEKGLQNADFQNFRKNRKDHY